MDTFFTKKQKKVVIVTVIILLVAFIGVVVFFFLSRARSDRIKIELMDTSKTPYSYNCDDFTITLNPSLTSDGEEVSDLRLKTLLSDSNYTVFYNYEGGLLSTIAFFEDYDTNIIYQVDFYMLFRGLVLADFEAVTYKADGYSMQIQEAIKQDLISVEDIIDEFDDEFYCLFR